MGHVDLHNAPVPMWIADVQTLQFLAVNEAAIAHYGYSRPEFLSMRLPDIRAPDDLPRLLGASAHHTDSFRTIGVATHLTKDGQSIKAQISTCGSRYGGRPAIVVMAIDVTRSVTLEEKVRSREHYFEALMANASDIVSVIERTGSIRYVSPAVERGLGFSPSELAGMNVFELIHVDDHHVASQRIRSSVPGREPYVCRVRSKSGGWRVFETIGRDLMHDPAVRGLILNSRDVTDIRRAEERLTHVSAASPAVLYSIRLEGTRLAEHWVSSNVQSLFGYSTEEATRPDWWRENLHPEDRMVAELQFKMLFEASNLTHEYRFRAADGKYRWVRDQLRLVRDVDGRPLKIVGSWMDATEFKTLQDQFLHSQKLEAVGQFAGAIAHDFNNILTAILGHTELMLAEVPSDDQHRCDLEEVKRGADRARELTRQLLAFSRKQVLRPVCLNLGMVVKEMEGMLRRLLTERIELFLDLDCDGTWVRADRSQLEQVLLNMVVNSRDALPQGGSVRVSAVIETANHDTQHDLPPGKYAVLSVSDTGTGIAPEIVPHIFDAYFTTKENGQGTGLGLATVDAIVKQCAGTIQLHTEPGVGTTFRIWLPWVESRPQPATAAPVTEKAPKACGDETVLVIDDESAVRALIARALRKCGYNVLEASRPAEALVLARSQRTLDLVVTDMVMPEMSGADVARRIEQLHPELKVLYISGYNEEEAIADVAATAVAFLQKPFSPATLTGAVRRILDAA